MVYGANMISSGCTSTGRGRSATVSDGVRIISDNATAARDAASAVRKLMRLSTTNYNVGSVLNAVGGKLMLKLEWCFFRPSLPLPFYLSSCMTDWHGALLRGQQPAC